MPVSVCPSLANTPPLSSLGRHHACFLPLKSPSCLRPLASSLAVLLTGLRWTCPPEHLQPSNSSCNQSSSHIMSCSSHSSKLGPAACKACTAAPAMLHRLALLSSSMQSVLLQSQTATMTGVWTMLLQSQTATMTGVRTVIARPYLWQHMMSSLSAWARPVPFGQSGASKQRTAGKREAGSKRQAGCSRSR